MNEEITKLFDAQEKWDHYLSFCAMKEDLSNLMYQKLFDALEEQFGEIVSEHILWSYDRFSIFDLRLFLSSTSNISLIFCLEKSKDTANNLIFSIWAGDDIDYENLYKKKIESLKALNVMKNDGSKYRYLIYEDIAKSISGKSHDPDTFAYLCYRETDKITKHIIDKIKAFIKDEVKVNSFKALVKEFRNKKI